MQYFKQIMFWCLAKPVSLYHEASNIVGVVGIFLHCQSSIPITQMPIIMKTRRSAHLVYIIRQRRGKKLLTCL